MRRRQVLTTALVLASGGALSAYTPRAFAAGEKTHILVGADTTFPPFESMVKGKVTGFDIELISAIAKAEGLTVTFKTLPFNGIIPSLQVGSIDAAVAGITILKSRMKNVDFSDPYYHSGLSILVKQNSPIQGFSDLKGKVIATKKATSSVDYLTSHGIPLSHIKQFQSIDAAYEVLETGGADAVLFDNPVNLNFKAKHKNVRIAGPLLTGEYYGIAVTKKEPWLVAKLNAGLVAIRKDGTYKELFTKYFGNDTLGLVTTAMTAASVAGTD